MNSANVFHHLGDLAWQALLDEVNLTPKPGLVDRRNSGAHQDMALDDFYRSAAAIRPGYRASSPMDLLLLPWLQVNGLRACANWGLPASGRCSVPLMA